MHIPLTKSSMVLLDDASSLSPPPKKNLLLQYTYSAHPGGHHNGWTQQWGRICIGRCQCLSGVWWWNQKSPAPCKREIKKPLLFKWLRKDTPTSTLLEKSHICAPRIITISMCAPSYHNNFTLMQPSMTWARDVSDKQFPCLTGFIKCVVTQESWTRQQEESSTALCPDLPINW